ncbi:hypothetical protein DB345_05490 [Spartobacteria bacterium LR76]|nr:hypothetical protein DB345_05490 [Spartobacteria bacterium LR76]
MKIFSPLLACVVVLGCSGRALSTEYLSNLSESTSGTLVVDGSRKVAQSFWSGSGSYSLISIILLMSPESANSDPLHVSLFSSSGEEVGSWLGDLGTGDPYSSAGGQHTWTPGASINLSSNTKYWIVLDTTESEHGYAWNYTSSMSASSEDGWSIPATNTYAVDTGSGWNYSDGRPQQIAVTASVVPEPGSVFLVSAGVLVCLAVVRLWRRQADAAPL